MEKYSCAEAGTIPMDSKLPASHVKREREKSEEEEEEPSCHTEPKKESTLPKCKQEPPQEIGARDDFVCKQKAPKRQRVIGDEEQTGIDKLDTKIDQIEKEIKDHASLYQQSRTIIAMGVTSLVAVNETRKMEKLIEELKHLKDAREKLMAQKDAHIASFIDGDERAVMIESIRSERSSRATLHPFFEEAISERAEIERRLMTQSDEKRGERANSSKCPSRCKELVEDHVGCVLRCVDCGYVYEQQYCNPNNPVCTMGKFGEQVEVPRRRSGGYKPPNHFAEIVGHFQGAKGTTVPPEILERVKDYCYRYKYEPREITPNVVRFFLRRMQQGENNRHHNAIVKNPADKLRRFTDFYRSAPEVAYRLSGIPPPYMSPMQEERITALFPLVIESYKTSPRYLKRMQMKKEEDCVKKYPNNPNYSFVFYKLCQLLGYDEFLPYIPLPKSIDNIDDNDQYAWQHVCEQRGWVYIPTR